MNNQELSFTQFVLSKGHTLCTANKFKIFITDYAATIGVLPQNADEESVLTYMVVMLTKGDFHLNKKGSFVKAFDMFFNQYHNRNLKICFKTPKNTETKIPDYFIYPELLLFFSKMEDDMYKMIFALMYLLGLKPGEVVNIEIKHYNEKLKSILFVNKIGVLSRKLNIPNPIALLIKKDRKRSLNKKYLFEDKHQEKISVKLLEQHFKTIFKKTHILKKVTLQVFRNSYIEHQIESGMDKKILLSLLGVNNLRYLSYYRLKALNNINTIRVFTDGTDLLDTIH